MLRLPPAFAARMIAARDRQRARERLEAMQDTLRAGQTDTGTVTTYRGPARPPSEYETSHEPLEEHLTMLDRMSQGLPPLTPEQQRVMELTRQRAKFQGQLRAIRGMQA